MKGTTIIIILAVVVLAAVTLQIFQFAAFKEKTAGVITGNAAGVLDTSSWTANEIMNYEMHGTIPARAAAGASAPKAVAAGAPAMVGGC